MRSDLWILDLRPIGYLRVSAGRVARAVGTAVNAPVNLDAMTDDLARAVSTCRGQTMNGALEAVEDVACARSDNLKALVVVVSTDLAHCHRCASLGSPWGNARER